MTAATLPAGAARGRQSEVYRLRYVIAFAVTLASVLELVDTSIVNVAIPHMMGNLGATLEEIAWVSTGYIVANVIILPITSFLSDRFGRRHYYTGSIAIFTIASLFCGNATSLEGLVFWRVVQGIGGGALISTAQAILFDIFPPEERAIGQAIFGMGVMVGPTIGPTLGGWITENFAWPWIFYINLPLGLLAGLLTWQYVPEPAHTVDRSGRMDWPGLALLILGIGFLQIMLERGEANDWFDSAEVRLEAALAAIGAIGFVWHELRTPNPIVNLRVLRDRQLAAGVLFGAALGFGLYSSVFALPVFLQNLLGFSAWDTGRVILPGALASAVTMAIVGRVTPKTDARFLILFGASLFMWSMWLHSRFTTQIGEADTFWPMILRGVGLGFIFVPLTGLAVAKLPPQLIPQGTGLFNLSRQLGGSVGIAIVATLVSRYTEQARAALVTHLDGGNAVMTAQLEQLARGFMARGAPFQVATAQAQAVLDRRVTGQATVLAFEQIFLTMGLVLLGSCVLLLLFRTGRTAGGGPAH